MTVWKEKNSELRSLIATKKRDYWRGFVGKLKEGDESKVWKTIKAIGTGDKSEGRNEVLLADGREARTTKQKANAFVKLYESTNKLKLEKVERKNKVRVMRKLNSYVKEEDEFGAHFTMEELKEAVAKLEMGKKGGDDGVEPAFWKHLGNGALVKWLDIFSESWRKGVCPGRWKKAVIIPILKMGKDPKERESYRPISLTSVSVKVLERMATNRLYYWLERDEVINNWQAGFQRGRSTEEQVLRLVQEVQDGFERRGGHEKTIAVTLDCSKAYDRVWKVKLVERMMEEGAPSPMVRWFYSFLEGRQACVRIEDSKSGWKRLQEGLPQGSVSSPALFLLYANDWGTAMESDVSYSGFADDVALWCTGRDVEVLKVRMQRALVKVEQWAGAHKIELNPSKSESCLFSRFGRDRDKTLGLRIANREIESKKDVVFLDIIIDQGLLSVSRWRRCVVKCANGLGFFGRWLVKSGDGLCKR